MKIIHKKGGKVATVAFASILAFGGVVSAYGILNNSPVAFAKGAKTPVCQGTLTLNTVVTTSTAWKDKKFTAKVNPGTDCNTKIQDIFVHDDNQKKNNQDYPIIGTKVKGLVSRFMYSTISNADLKTAYSKAGVVHHYDVAKGHMTLAENARLIDLFPNGFTGDNNQIYANLIQVWQGKNGSPAVAYADDLVTSKHNKMTVSVNNKIDEETLTINGDNISIPQEYHFDMDDTAQAYIWSNPKFIRNGKLTDPQLRTNPDQPKYTFVDLTLNIPENVKLAPKAKVQFKSSTFAPYALMDKEGDGATIVEKFTVDTKGDIRTFDVTKLPAKTKSLTFRAIVAPNKAATFANLQEGVSVSFIGATPFSISKEDALKLAKANKGLVFNGHISGMAYSSKGLFGVYPHTDVKDIQSNDVTVKFAEQKTPSKPVNTENKVNIVAPNTGASFSNNLLPIVAIIAVISLAAAVAPAIAKK